MSHKIYVGNLSYQTTEDDLKSLVATYGNVLSVRIISDRDTGRSKGFAFVEFEAADAMSGAIEELDGKEFQGRNLRVNEAQDKPRDSRPRRF